MGFLRELQETVIKNDYCIGCGICASVEGSPLEMRKNDEGKLEPFNVKDESDSNINYLELCPFSKNNNVEDELAYEAFGKTPGIKKDAYSGYYLETFAGYVKDNKFRQRGSSGGLGSWIAAKLLEEDMVDTILHVKNTEDSDGILFNYQLSNDLESLKKGAKSKYYPIELSEVMNYVKNNEGRYAIIGIPCFIKGVKLLENADYTIKKRIKYHIGLVCGHLKSDFFAKSMGWQLGIDPDNLNEIDFRKKLPNLPSNKYGVQVKGKVNNETVQYTSPTKDLFTTNWGHGFFKYNACDFCDDVLAETADITIGDAWLPQYTEDNLGTNVIVVRNPDIRNIIEKYRYSQLYLDELTSDQVYESQAGGFRHRREGLSYRLYLMDKEKKWRPNKRVEPANTLEPKRKKIYEYRMKLVGESFNAFIKAQNANDFQILIDRLNPIIKDYERINKGNLFERIRRKLIKNLN